MRLAAVAPLRAGAAGARAPAPLLAELTALQDRDRRRTEFLGTLAHELRSPLTVVCGYVELLQVRAAALPPEAADPVARIGAAAAQLTRLVDDLAHLERIERGGAAVRAAPLDLAPVLREALAGVRGRAGGERLVADIRAPLPARADRHRIAQVVENLLANALKYAPAGPIVLRARRAGRAGRVRVAVADRGPGVPPAERARVWERFYRGAAAGGAAPGSGVGLAVVKALVEAHGGRVGLRSAAGRGACFWLELPAPGDPAG